MPALRRLLAAACAAAAILTLSNAAEAASPAHYRSVAAKGIAAAKRHWWNGGSRWYDDRLHDHDAYPLATIWSIVPLFEAIDAQAIAQPTKARRAAVRSFAKGAERYWNPNVAPYGAWAPYPGDRSSSERTWFDDNGWWGLAFVDAYRATHDHRYLEDAARALRFIDARGWDGGRGMWWNTAHPHHSLEALSSAAALAAELYEQTGRSSYRKIARKYVAWAEKHAKKSERGLYATDEQPVMSYVEGAMLGAHVALCRKGDAAACRRAHDLAQACFEKWAGKSPDHAPQFDTILMRYLLQLGDVDHDPTWYDWVRRVADRAEDRAHSSGGLFLRFWDGSKPTDHGDGAGGFDSGMLQTHSATVALLAWLGATRRPPGKARQLPDGSVAHPQWESWITVKRIEEDGAPLCYVQGHVRGWSAQTVPWTLVIQLTDSGVTDSRERGGVAPGGRKTSGAVTILKRHLARADHPVEVDLTATVGGERLTSHRRLAPPWC
jgi:hypothetical protein